MQVPACLPASACAFSFLHRLAAPCVVTWPLAKPSSSRYKHLPRCCIDWRQHAHATDTSLSWNLNTCNMVSQILEGGDPAEVAQLAQLLDFVDAELLGSCNFEFLQVPVLQLGHAQCMEQRQLPAQCHCCQWLSCRNLQVGRAGRAEETEPHLGCRRSCGRCCRYTGRRSWSMTSCGGARSRSSSTCASPGAASSRLWRRRAAWSGC